MGSLKSLTIEQSWESAIKMGLLVFPLKYWRLRMSPGGSLEFYEICFWLMLIRLWFDELKFSFFSSFLICSLICSFCLKSSSYCLIRLV